MNLEYFIASLPMLAQGRPAAISPEAFQEACDSSLSPALAGAVRAILDDQEADDPFVRAWRARDTQIRNAVARRRAARLGVPAPAVRPFDGFDAQVEPAVNAAFEEKDPLRREQALDALRWRVAEDLQGVAPFSAAVVLAYAAKLRILAREGAIDEAAGRERFRQLSTYKKAQNA